MGFLESRLGATTRIELGGDYWVEVRPLNKGDISACQARLQQLSFKMDFDSSDQRRVASGALNVDAYQEEVVCRSLVGWNLDDENGILPYDTLEKARASYRRLPNDVADQLFRVCDELNAPPSKEEERSFRDGGDGSTSQPEESATSDIRPSDL